MKDANDESIDIRSYFERLMDEADRRYEERFHAAERAVVTTLARTDKEFHEHLEQVRVETAAALAAADKAIQKSEAAVEKRFDAVNEFRAQLSDQAASFMPRKESDVRMDALIERIDASAERINALQLQISSRLDLTQGQAQGSREATVERRASNSAVIGIVGIGITIVLAMLTIAGFVIARIG